MKLRLPSLPVLLLCCSSVPAIASPSIEEARALLRGLQGHLDDRLLDRAALEGMLRAVDPGGRLLDAQDLRFFEEEETGTITTAGLLPAPTNGVARVAAILDAAPAVAGPIQVGDIIERIDGTDIRGLAVHAVEALLHGPEETSVTLERQTPDGELESVVVPRARLRWPGIASAEMWPFDIGYLRLRGLYEGTGAELADRIDRWVKAKAFALVLDLRGAGGRNGEAALQAAARIVRAPDFELRWHRSGGEEAESVVLPSGKAAAPPVLVLVDEDTRGASALLAALLRDRHSGSMVLGQPTQCDLLLREAIPLRDDRAMLVRTRTLTTPDGSTYEGTAGVQPHIVMGRDRARTAANGPAETEEEDRLSEARKALRTLTHGDPALIRALDILMALHALGAPSEDE